MSSQSDEWPRAYNLPDYIGPYEIIGKLGGGGMATVYLGRTVGVGGFHRLFAIKRIHEHLSSDEAFAKMFLNEARIAAKIHHPGIVSVYDVGEEEGRLHIAMDYLRGETLSFLLNRAWKGGPGIPYHVMTHLLASACDALHLAHELRDDNGEFLGVIHRDLSPRNMMIGYDGFLRVLDFGVAKAENQYPKTRTGTQKGTVAYMAPEQILGRPLDRRLDIFALGVVLWEATVGKRLFAASNDFATAAKVRQAQIPIPSKIRPDYPGGLERIVLKALRREPEERYQTARELGDALRVFLATSPQLIASTDVSDMVHRLCSDRLQKRLEMEKSGLVRLDSVVDEPPSSGSISLNVSAALPIDSDDYAGRDRTERLDSQTGEPATTQNFSRDKTISEALTGHDEVPTAQGVVPGLDQKTERSQVARAGGSLRLHTSSERSYDTLPHDELATDHLGSGHARVHEEETIESHTDSREQLLPEVLFDIEASSTGEGTTRDEQGRLRILELTDREGQGEEETIGHEEDHTAEDTARENRDPALSYAQSPPPPPEPSMPSLEELDPDFLIELSEEESGLRPRPVSGPTELPVDDLYDYPDQPAPPIDAALAALESASQLDHPSEFLEISRPRLELADEGGRKPPRAPTPSLESGAGFRPGSDIANRTPHKHIQTAVVFRDRIDGEGDAYDEAVRLMSPDAGAFVDQTLPPLASSDVRSAPGGRTKFFVLFVLLFLLAALLAAQFPEVQRLADRILAGGSEPTEPPGPARDAPAPVMAKVEPTPAETRDLEVELADPVVVTFDVHPSEAVILVDGEPSGEKLEVSSSTRTYHVEVSAAGHVPKELVVSAKKSRQFSVTLEKLPAAAPPEPKRKSRRKSGRRTR